MSEKGRELYQKRKATMIANRFAGDEDAYDSWMSARMSGLGRKGGAKSSNRPFTDTKLASEAGKRPRRRKIDREQSIHDDINTGRDLHED